MEDKKPGVPEQPKPSGVFGQNKSPEPQQVKEPEKSKEEPKPSLEPNRVADPNNLASKFAEPDPNARPKKLSVEEVKLTGDPLEDTFNEFKAAKEDYINAKLDVVENEDDAQLIQGYRDVRSNALSRFITIKDKLVGVLESETKR